jgi:hypothetical protein
VVPARGARPAGGRPGARLCVLHCGYPKTGSTSLQNFLDANTPALLARGVLYPAGGRAGGFRRNAHLHHGGALRTIGGANPPGLEPGLPEALAAEIDRVPHEVLILSSEHLARLLFFDHRPAIPAFLLSRGYRIETVTFLRDQPDYLTSAYVQQVKTGHEAADFDAFCRRRIGGEDPDDEGRVAIDYRGLTRKLHRAWGTHGFRPFAAGVKATGIEADFHAGLAAILARHGRADLLPGAETLPVPPRMNESGGPLTVAIGRRIAALVMREHRGRPLRFVTRNILPLVEAELARRGIAEPRYVALTPARWQALRARFAEGNAIFARRAWGRVWAAEFPEPAPETLVSNDLDETGDRAGTALADEIVAALRPAIEASVATEAAALAAARAARRGRPPPEAPC